MEENKITFIEVPIDLFMELVEVRARAKALMAYVNSEKYSISRRTIADICGFALKGVNDDEE